MQKPFDISDALLRELHDSETRSAAFGRLLESCLTPLYWHARRLVVVHEDAEDVVQETLLRAYKGIDRFRGDGPALKAWLYRIATNRALSLLGRRRRSLLTPLDAVSRTLAGRVSEQAAPSCSCASNRRCCACLSSNGWFSTCAITTKCPMPRSPGCCGSGKKRCASITTWPSATSNDN